jgi:hypothetical protein
MDPERYTLSHVNQSGMLEETFGSWLAAQIFD